MEFTESFAGTYDTEHTYFIVEQVESPEMEFIDFEQEDDEGNTIITFGLARISEQLMIILSGISEYFYLNFRNSLNLYVATLEFIKLFSLQKGKFCTYDSFKNSFLYQIYIHVISSDSTVLSYCRENHILLLDTCKRMEYQHLIDMYETNFVKCEQNLSYLRSQF